MQNVDVRLFQFSGWSLNDEFASVWWSMRAIWHIPRVTRAWRHHLVQSIWHRNDRVKLCMLNGTELMCSRLSAACLIHESAMAHDSTCANECGWQGKVRILWQNESKFRPKKYAHHFIVCIRMINAWNVVRGWKKCWRRIPILFHIFWSLVISHIESEARMQLKEQHLIRLLSMFMHSEVRMQFSTIWSEIIQNKSLRSRWIVS